jgi:hypothetical protein
MEERGSIDMPRVMEGLGSMREVACAFPFRANIADGLELVRLRLEHEERAKGGGDTRRVIGTVSLAIDNELRLPSQAVILL